MKKNICTNNVKLSVELSRINIMSNKKILINYYNH